MNQGKRESAPERATDSSAQPRGLQGADVVPEERVGPLLLTRHRKRDGRALLLYTRIAAAAEPPAAHERLPSRPAGGREEP